VWLWVTTELRCLLVCHDDLLIVGRSDDERCDYSVATVTLPQTPAVSSVAPPQSRALSHLDSLFVMRILLFSVIILAVAADTSTRRSWSHGAYGQRVAQRLACELPAGAAWGTVKHPRVQPFRMAVYAKDDFVSEHVKVLTIIRTVVHNSSHNHAPSCRSTPAPLLHLILGW
jgi:hypothetical protein